MIKKNVLVVDDEEAILLAFKKLLQRPGVNVDGCDSLLGAKEKVIENFYDVVIADLRLSGTLSQEGFELIQFVKDRSAETKIVLITAYGSNSIKEKARETGADFYYEKPVSVNNLNEILKSIGVE